MICRLCGGCRQDGDDLLCGRCLCRFREFCYRQAWHGRRADKLVARAGGCFDHYLAKWLAFLITAEPSRLGEDVAVCTSWRRVSTVAVTA